MEPKHKFVDQFRVTCRALQRGQMRRGDSVVVREGHPDLPKWRKDPAFSVLKIGRVQLDVEAAARAAVPSKPAQAIVRDVLGTLEGFRNRVRALAPDARHQVAELIRARPAIRDLIDELIDMCEPGREPEPAEATDLEPPPVDTDPGTDGDTDTEGDEDGEPAPSAAGITREAIPEDGRAADPLAGEEPAATSGAPDPHDLGDAEAAPTPKAKPAAQPPKTVLPPKGKPGSSRR